MADITVQAPKVSTALPYLYAKAKEKRFLKDLRAAGPGGRFRRPLVLQTFGTFL